MRGGGGLDLATHGNSLSASVSVRRSIYPPCPADGCEGRSGQSSCCRSGSSRASPACLPHAPGSPATRGPSNSAVRRVTARAWRRSYPVVGCLLAAGRECPRLAAHQPLGAVALARHVPSPCCRGVSPPVHCGLLIQSWDAFAGRLAARRDRRRSCNVRVRDSFHAPELEQQCFHLGRVVALHLLTRACESRSASLTARTTRISSRNHRLIHPVLYSR